MSQTTTAKRRRTSSTEDVLKAMLVEPTGRRLTDSGDYYGRHYERNRGRDFDAEPETTYTFYVESDGKVFPDVTLNVYHWLKERLEFDPRLQRAFDRFEKTTADGETWFEVAERFLEARAKKHPVKGLHGESDGPMVVNTYNGEDCLSQVVQFYYWEEEERYGDAFCLLMIHNGCDARFGYTAPKAFRVTGEKTNLFFNADFTVGCAEGHYWDFVNGGTCEYSEEQCQDWEWYKGTDNPDLKGGGCIYVDADGNAFCPECGAPLSAHGPVVG